MASTCDISPDLVAALKIPKFIRVPKGQAKPKYVAPSDVELEGELAAKFISEVVARTRHYSANKVAEIGSVAKVYGTARSNPKLGTLLGGAFGRWWYVVA